MIVVAGKLLSLLIDTRANFSALPEFAWTLVPSLVSTMGVDGLVSQLWQLPPLFGVWNREKEHYTL